MDFLDPANGAGLHQQHRHAVEARRVDLDAHLRDHALPAGKLSQLPHFVEVMGQRLLAIDVLAQLQRAHGDRRMHVVGRGDVHRVDDACLPGPATRASPGKSSRVGKSFLSSAVRFKSTSATATRCSALGPAPVA